MRLVSIGVNEIHDSTWNALSGEAQAKVGRINTHTYSVSGTRQLASLAKKTGKNLWVSEVDGGHVAGSGVGEMGAALWLGEKIISDMNTLSPSAWVLWQVVDSHISAEGWQGNKDSGMVNTLKGYWGTAVADHDRGTIILTQKYYALGQFTRFIRPGARIIPCGQNALAAYDAAKQELIVVAVNSSAQDRSAFFDLSRFKHIGTTLSVTRTSGSLAAGESWARLEDMRAEEQGFAAMLKAQSITTYAMTGVILGAP